MSTKIIGFKNYSYGRFSSVKDNENYKNIVPLDKMTPYQRYELALDDDDEDVIIWDSLEAFLTDLNDELVDVEEMWFYDYKN